MDDATIVVIVGLICITIIGLVMMYYENRRKEKRQPGPAVSHSSFETTSN